MSLRLAPRGYGDLFSARSPCEHEQGGAGLGDRSHPLSHSLALTFV